MIPLLEAVPNFSEGRDLGVVREIVAAISAAGAEVLDWSADPDHHRSVVTFIAEPGIIEDAAVAGALTAFEAIDLRRHRGVHPRVGALDVLPFVPLGPLPLGSAVETAHKVGVRLADAGVPVYYYGAASDPSGRRLSELRRGGFERLVQGFPENRVPDELPREWAFAGVHPTLGATCVGARRPLLAWNVFVLGISLEVARAIASRIREAGGGFPGLRALGLHLPRQGRIQISMNLEDLDRVSPLDVFLAVESEVLRHGGEVTETEVIGMIPDALLHGAAQDRLRLSGFHPDRVLSRRVRAHGGH